MNKEYEIGEKIEVTVEEFTPLGVIVTFNSDEGLVYKEDIFEKLEIDQVTTAYIKEIREDGKIDVTFRRYGYRNFIGSTTDRILQALKDNNGTLELSDKSSPGQIKAELGISKTQFKQAIGSLYKDRKILITEEGIKSK